MPDRTVFLTGCSTGIGCAAAKAFGARGYRVVATARRLEELAGLERDAQAGGWTLRIATCDVSDDASRRSAIDFARQAFGPVEILVNNAGFGLMGLVELADLNDARRQLEVNTFGPMALVQLVAPDMRAAGGGRIINVSSVLGKSVIPFSGWYAASKHALEALNDALRLELRPFGIRTVSVLPGPVKTEFVRNILLATREENKPELYRTAEKAYVEYRRRPRPFEISPEAVARTIVRAAEAENPRPRYYLTVPAKVEAIGRRFITDRMMDWIVRKLYGIDRLTRGARQS